MKTQDSKFYLQSKNGTRAAWVNEKAYVDLPKAIQACEQLKKGQRGKNGLRWFKTRVAVQVGDGWSRVYPEQKQNPRGAQK